MRRRLTHKLRVEGRKTDGEARDAPFALMSTSTAAVASTPLRRSPRVPSTRVWVDESSESASEEEDVDEGVEEESSDQEEASERESVAQERPSTFVSQEAWLKEEEEGLQLLPTGDACLEAVSVLIFKADAEGRFACRCPVAGCSFTSPHYNHVDRHYEEQHLDLMFECHLCYTPFARLHSLRQHMLSHKRNDGHRVQECDDCIQRLLLMLPLSSDQKLLPRAPHPQSLSENSAGRKGSRDREGEDGVDVEASITGASGGLSSSPERHSTSRLDSPTVVQVQEVDLTDDSD